MRKNDWLDDFIMYEICNNESDDNPTGNSECLPWILGGLVVVGILSKILG